MVTRINRIDPFTGKRRFRRWSPDKVLSLIRFYKEHGIRLNFGFMFVFDQGLVKKAMEYFGSWKNAVERAGYKYEDERIHYKKKWPVETLRPRRMFSPG